MTERDEEMWSYFGSLKHISCLATMQKYYDATPKFHNVEN